MPIRSVGRSVERVVISRHLEFSKASQSGDSSLEVTGIKTVGISELTKTEYLSMEEVCGPFLRKLQHSEV